jgi:CopA family copper-resistance protein
MRHLLFLLALFAALPAQAATHDLVIERIKLAVEPGRPSTVIAINGSVPGPVLHFTEGQTETIRVTNKLAETTSIHWHGLLVPPPKDGAPGFNAFAGIKPGETFTYTFPIRQNGTYWYHAHSATQEQAGQYGAMIIAPKAADPIVADRTHVVLISELTREDPERILRNIKGDSDYYNFNKRTLPQMLKDAGKFGLGATLKDRAQWATMRMDPTDIADVSGYRLLVNGQPPARQPWLQAKPGEKIRLRLINGTAMSLVDVRIPGLAMTIVAADGRQVEPVTVDEFRMGVAETYDVIVTPTDEKPLALWIETIDRRAQALVSLSADASQRAEAPAPRPRQILLVSEMGHDMAAMAGASGADCPPEHAAMGHCTPTAATATTPKPPATNADCPPEHAAMGHCMPVSTTKSEQIATKPAATDPACPLEHAAMGHCTPRAAAVAPLLADPDCPPEHAAMGHCTPKAAALTGSAVVADAGATPFPRVDYGYGSDPMAGMNHAAMGHTALAAEGETDGSGRVFGWATGAPRGARVLSMRDLRAATPQTDLRKPTQTIVIKVAGNMQRYIWTLNGAKYGEASPLRVKFGDRVRITFVNESMMAHPMHLHGMFFQLENDQPMDRLPDKNVIVIAPGRTQSILLTANEAGEWPLHCHLLYHMESGMMQKLIVASVDNPDGSAPAAGHVH